MHIMGDEEKYNKAIENTFRMLKFIITMIGGNLFIGAYWGFLAYYFYLNPLKAFPIILLSLILYYVKKIYNKLEGNT